MPGEWIHSFPGEIIICDAEGIILEMSDIAIELYQKEGGKAMIGHNVFDHHREPSRSQVRRIIKRRKPYMYTAERGGQKKFITIAPWYHEGGEYAGFALVVLDFPAKMAHLVKDRSQNGGSRETIPKTQINKP